MTPGKSRQNTRRWLSVKHYRGESRARAQHRALLTVRANEEHWGEVLVGELVFHDRMLEGGVMASTRFDFETAPP